MMQVGASLKASIRSGAGFGTLVMAVVMLMQIIPPVSGPPPSPFPHGAAT
jgi:hypothetical protein